MHNNALLTTDVYTLRTTAAVTIHRLINVTYASSCFKLITEQTPDVTWSKIMC